MAESPTEAAWACQQLIVKLAHLIDHSGLAQIESVVAPDAVVHLFGQEVRGAAAIRELFEARMTGAVLRHTLTPSQVEMRSKDTAWAMTYVTVYRGAKTEGADPLPLTGPVNVVEYEDEFARLPQGWRIVRREIRMIFRA
jgi:ketosteroid isomerase-like protein